MLFPVGIKAQEMARFQIYASAKAEEMVESFTSTTNANPSIDTEGLMPWDTSGGYRAQAWDLEARLSSPRYGIMPLPLALAGRLDSDNDEIQQVLSQGGYIYYSQAMATTETEEQGNPASPPNDIQKLIFAVSGYAQQNCLHMMAMKDWPYFCPMPSPPLNASHMPDMWIPPNGNQAGGAYWSYHPWPSPLSMGPTSYYGEDWDIPWESIPSNLDPDMHVVYDWPLVPGMVHVGYFPYACGLQLQNHNGPTTFPDGYVGVAPSMTGAIGYAQAAVWYFQKKLGTGTDYFSPGNVQTLDAHAPFLTNTETDRWKEVQAFRFLSHAATTLTSWFAYSDTASGHMDLSNSGVTIPPMTANGFTSMPPAGQSSITIFDQGIRYYHERAMYLIMQFCAMYPYDWAIPRPTNRTIMMDYPLIMSDMWSPPLVGTVFGSQPNAPAVGWRPVSAEPIQHIGVSQTYPVMNATSSQSPSWTIPAGIIGLDATMQQGSSASAQVNGSIFGNIDHYTLAAPFKAAERCREIVFWAVDWQSYEDFETLPSAPVDASKYALSSPRCTSWGANNGSGSSWPPWYNQRNMYLRMGDMQFRDEQMWAFRNPEKCELFMQPTANVATGTVTTGWEILNNPWNSAPDQGSGTTQESVFSGLYGADRNYNQVLDRGPVPRSVRLRAQLVARFNFYDPRVQAILR
jgi:hypothetical protein